MVFKLNMLFSFQKKRTVFYYLDHGWIGHKLLKEKLNMCFNPFAGVSANIFCRFLAKILVADGSKDVPVGQPIAITVNCDNPGMLLTSLT